MPTAKQNETAMPFFTAWILGRSAILKNSRRLSKGVSLPSKAFAKWRRHALPIMMEAWGRTTPYEGPVRLRIEVRLAAQEGAGNVPDLSNLYQGVEDMLEEAHVIENDRQIVSHDGSARICLCSGPCPQKGTYQAGPRKGQSRANCGAVSRCPFQGMLVELYAASKPTVYEEWYRKEKDR